MIPYRGNNLYILLISNDLHQFVFKEINANGILTISKEPMVFYSEDNYKISSYLQGGESSLSVYLFAE
jgi:hypothetical protein